MMGVSLGSSKGGGDPFDYKPVAEINVTPLVDVMLVLLVIFMVAAPLMMTGVPVELPKTSAAKLGQVKAPLVVTLGKDGALYVRDDQVHNAGLIPRLQELKQLEGDSVVYVRADKGAAYGEVMELLGRIGGAGFERVSLLANMPPADTPAKAQ